MQVTLLGAVSARLDDARPVDLGSIKQRGLLAQLALEPNRPMNLDRLAEGIWGELVPERYRQNIQVYVSNLRRALEPGRVAGSPSRIIGHGEAYEFVAADNEIDVTRFRNGIAEGRASIAAGRPRAASEELSRALVQWTGDPLSDLFALPFAAGWIGILEGLRLDGVELRCDARLALGEHRELVGELDELVARHPGRENLWCQLATALVRSGRQNDALEVARRARTVLVDEYGLDPGPSLAALEGQILEQDQGLLGVRPPAVQLASVPVPLGPSIGRDADRTAVSALVEAGHRLVSLTGPGGVGKTRLALDVLNALADERTLWVSLADRPARTTIAEAVGSLLQVPQEAVAEVLAVERHVIGLDNLEHIDDAPEQVARLLGAAPQLAMLVTSRGRLGIEGEIVYEVPVLDTATSGWELFVERARAALPSFDSERNRDAVLELCERLDGLPLAIELAAARVGVLEPAEILRTLPDVSVLRTTGPRSARQASLAGAVEWSVRLLDPAQRAALAALAIFDGPFALDDAASAIAAVESAGEDPARSIEALTRVGLLQPIETAAGRRFTMLRTIRAVVDQSEVLDATGASREVLDAVASLWLAAPHAQRLRDDWSTVRINTLVVGVPVLRQLVGHLVLTGRCDDAARLVCTQRRGFWASGQIDTFLTLLGMIPADGLSAPWRARSSVLTGCAQYATQQNDCGPLLDALAELGPEDQAYRVHALCNRAVMRADEGAVDAAEADIAAAVAAAGDDTGLALIVRSAATWVGLASGTPDEAIRHARAAVDLAVGGAPERELVVAVNDLAMAELFTEDGVARAIDLSQEFLLRARRFGSPVDIAETLTNLGCGLIRSHRVGEGMQCLIEAMDLVAKHADWGRAMDRVIMIAVGSAATGLLDEAQRLLDRAAARTRANGYDGDPISELVRGLAQELALVPRPETVVAPPSLDELVATARALAVRVSMGEGPGRPAE